LAHPLKRYQEIEAGGGGCGSRSQVVGISAKVQTPLTEDEGRGTMRERDAGEKSGKTEKNGVRKNVSRKKDWSVDENLVKS